MKWYKLLVSVLSLALVLSVSVALAVPTDAAENLAVNGDLEMGSTNGWDISSASLDSGVSYGGSYSLKLTATSAYAGAAYKAVPVNKNGTVTVSFYYRYTASPSSNLYHVYTYQGPDVSVGPYSSGADASFKAPTGCNSISSWQKVSYTFNAGNYDTIYLKFAPGGNGGTACYIDNLVVTCEGGEVAEVAPYLTSFGTRYNRPNAAANNLIQNGGFESTANAPWNVSTFLKGDLSVVSDSTAPEGSKSLYLASGDGSVAWYTFSVPVEKGNQYVFSAWVKSPRLSAENRATATFGVADANTGDFLVYEPYNGGGYGSASLSTTSMQLMATSPDDQWHLRSVTFYSGTATSVLVTVYGGGSQLYLDDVALYKSAYGIEYISDLRSEVITPSATGANKYCADEHSLIPQPHMSGSAAQEHWSANPAWRNGFLSFADAGDDHGTVLQYNVSEKPLKLAYIDWIDVLPETSYTLTMDVKRLNAGDGRIALLDDNYNSPVEFYTLSFSSVDADWVTYSITFNTGVYSRIGFAIVDGGGTVYIDKTRLFQTTYGIAEEPADVLKPSLYPVGVGTSTMETQSDVTVNVLTNNGFETGDFSGWMPYQDSEISSAAADSGTYGAHLKGDGSWGALLEQLAIPVENGRTYTFSFRYKANSNGVNVTLKGATTNTQYAYHWANVGEWTELTATFTVDGDARLILNICGGGNGIKEDVYMDNLTLVAQPNPKLGVAFLMQLEAAGAQRDEHFVGDLSHATVDVYGDGTRYSLVRMGALMTNDDAVGADKQAFVLENVRGDHVLVDVNAVNLYDVGDDYATYAVRIVNIPSAYQDRLIYARPYYVFEQDGEEIVVYGDVYYRSYTVAEE